MKLNSLKSLLSRHRLSQFDKIYEFNSEKKVVPKAKNVPEINNLTATVTFSYVHDGLKFAAILSELLNDASPNIKTTLLSGSAAAARREIDSCDLVVIFVTDEYLKSELHMQELHMALCRQRTEKESTVVYLVQVSFN